MAFILVSQVLRFVLGQKKTGKRERENHHGKDCEEEGWCTSPAGEEEDGCEARRQRPSQAGFQACRPEVSGASAQGCLNSGSVPAEALAGQGPGREGNAITHDRPEVILVGVGDAGRHDVAWPAIRRPVQEY